MIEAPLVLEVHSAIVVEVDGTQPSAPAGGGAGGSIVIKTNDLIGEGDFSASGGAGYKGGGGGGGGIIVLQAADNSAIAGAVADIEALAAGVLGIDELFQDSVPLRKFSARDPLPGFLALLCRGSFPALCFRDGRDHRDSVVAWARHAHEVLSLITLIADVDAARSSSSPVRRAVLVRANEAAMSVASLFVRCADAAMTVIVDPLGVFGWRLTSHYGYLPSWVVDCVSPAFSASRRTPDVLIPPILTRADLAAAYPAAVAHWRALWSATMPTAGTEIAQNFNGNFWVTGGEGSTGSQPAASGGDGSFVAPRCPAGFGGLPRCDPCGVGSWRNASLDAPYFCASCDNKPARGTYVDAEAESSDCA
jgi:hypothetical protein